ncbi:protein ENHANCED DISEASE RESISTANCE 2-like [Dorcoceras hygrometricum]|uniref:Protein ENHANCED DISEASE RESISTANCE 2-like n=1 Tax=Dorcoceras hygrometricum TaxID=472368 RepID=A0A2Z7CD29_9LAMI|nr:protein ENHANCED DISEASE RESISTANCE 2-like [Dorcoceras hygrometricum]
MSKLKAAKVSTAELILKTTKDTHPKAQKSSGNSRVPLGKDNRATLLLRDPLQGQSTASKGYQSKEEVTRNSSPPISLRTTAEKAATIGGIGLWTVANEGLQMEIRNIGFRIILSVATLIYISLNPPAAAHQNQQTSKQ